MATVTWEEAKAELINDKKIRRTSWVMGKHVFRGDCHQDFIDAGVYPNGKCFFLKTPADTWPGWGPNKADKQATNWRVLND